MSKQIALTILLTLFFLPEYYEMWLFSLSEGVI